MRSACLLAFLVGCGRVGFDDHALSIGDAGFTSRHWVSRGAGAPGILYAPKLIYHPLRRTVILYGGGGGQTSNIVSDEMWEWDGTTWTRLCAGCAPGARKYHAMTYDSARDRIVLFGGRPGGVELDDTWEWDGTTWTERTPATRPPPREGAQMGYDPDRRRVVLMGACGGRNDVWEWDGTSWTNPVAAGGPIAMGGHGSEITYDLANHRLLVVADTCNEADVHDELFSWDGTAWTRICDGCSGRARMESALIYDRALATTYLAGGFDGVEVAGTWKLVGDAWLRIDPNLPPARDSTGIAYDEARDVIVMYGGNGDSCDGDCDDTWELVPD